MARKSGFVRRGGVMRRETVWVALPRVTATLGGAPTAIMINTLSAGGLALRPFTIVRTRGVVQVVSDQNIATETYLGALGISVVSEQAIAIGVTAVPTPVTDQGSDLFFVYEEVIGRFEFGSNIGFDAAGGRFIQYDSKAMRRVNEGSDVAVVVENDIAGTQMEHSARMLLKLH